MSARRSATASRRARTYAPIFAALGDDTRLALVSKLADGEAHSISELSEGARVTRQAITKHLRVLASAGVVRNKREGRENLFSLEMSQLTEARQYLDTVSAEWDRALERLRAFVERD